MNITSPAAMTLMILHAVSLTSVAQDEPLNLNNTPCGCLHSIDSSSCFQCSPGEFISVSGQKPIRGMASIGDAQFFSGDLTDLTDLEVRGVQNESTSVSSSPGPAHMTFTPMERFIAWLLGMLMLPWMLASLLQCILRSESLLLHALLIASWMALVAGTGWYLWGHQNVLPFTFTAIPLLGTATPYFAFVCDRVDLLRYEK